MNINPVIKFTFDGPKTICKKYGEDGSLIARGVARCHPEDDFEEKMGMDIAYERMLEDCQPKLKIGDIVTVTDDCYLWGSDAHSRYYAVVKLNVDGKPFLLPLHTEHFTHFCEHGIHEHHNCFCVSTEDIVQILEF